MLIQVCEFHIYHFHQAINRQDLFILYNNFLFRITSSVLLLRLQLLYLFEKERILVVQALYYLYEIISLELPQVQFTLTSTFKISNAFPNEPLLHVSDTPPRVKDVQLYPVILYRLLYVFPCLCLLCQSA